MQRRPACSSPHHRAGRFSAGCWRGAGEVISETHHGFWNPLRGHTGAAGGVAGLGGTSDAVRMITFQKLEAPARKVFRGQLTNSSAAWNAWRGGRRKGEFILLKTRFLCLSPGWCLSSGPNWDCDFLCLDRVLREGWKEPLVWSECKSGMG